MDARRQTRPADRASIKRRQTPESSAEADEPLFGAVRDPSGPSAAESAPNLGTGTVLGLQRAIGNRAVGLMLARRARKPGAAEALRKSVEQEEELAKVQRLVVLPPALTKSAEGEEELAKSANGGCGPNCGCALCSASPEGDVQGAAAVQRSTDAVTVAVDQVAPGPDTASVSAGMAAGRLSPAAELLAKPSLDVRSGAAASIPVGTDYGLTYPESVDVKITAKKDKAAGTWSPKVEKLTGHYSMQTNLLAGQSEITGPGGNTSDTNFCAQCASLAALGYGGGHLWYILKAVVKHEQVHATRFKPGLKNAAAAITTALEAVSVADAPGMTKTQAIADLQADATFQAAVTNAQALWLAEIFTLVANDHDASGATDTAEKKVTEPMLKKICAHAKKKKWPACASCP